MAVSLESFRQQGVVEPEACFVTSVAVGFPVTFAQMSIAGGRRQYQVMRWGEEPGPAKEFWFWHLENRPQWFDTPAQAAAAFVQSWLEWGSRGPTDPDQDLGPGDHS
jgi:hypothetical protein